MIHYNRNFESIFKEKTERPWVHILFGARQTGKSTLIRHTLPDDAYIINLANPAQRATYAAHPQEFIRLCRSMPKRDTVQAA